MGTGPFDARALVELGRRHPDELRELRDALLEQAGGWVDRYGRGLGVGSKVVTEGGEVGRITGFDERTRRAWVRVESSDRVRLLTAHRLELKRGRPRRGSLAADLGIPHQV